MIIGRKGRRLNVISHNSSTLLESLKLIIFFMKEYIKIEKYVSVAEFAQLLSKAHFFKWQNRIREFKIQKQ